MRASSARPCSSVSTFCCLANLQRMLNAIASTSLGSRTRTSNSSIRRTSSHARGPSSPNSRAKTVAMSRSEKSQYRSRGVAFNGSFLVPSTPSSLSSSLSSLGTSRSSSISLLEGGVGQCDSLPLEAKKASKSSIPANESQSLKAGESGNDRETSIVAREDPSGEDDEQQAGMATQRIKRRSTNE
jgi:hypothetical protein